MSNNMKFSNFNIILKGPFSNEDVEIQYYFTFIIIYILFYNYNYSWQKIHVEVYFL